MSDPKSDNRTDPFEQWRGLRDSYMEAWAKALVEGVNTEAYSKASGALLDACLTASTPLREALEKSMLEALKQLAMPSRSDIVSLAERMTNVEVRLDDLDIKLDQIATALRQIEEKQAAQYDLLAAALKAQVRQPAEPATALDADAGALEDQATVVVQTIAAAPKSGKKG